MKPFGEYRREHCPVCGSLNIDPQCWKIPIGVVEPAVVIRGAAANLLPVLDATMRADFDRCIDCQSVFLNPVPSAQYQSDDYAAGHLAKPSRLDGYRDRWRWIRRHLLAADTVLADVCCGAGELLELARADAASCWKLMVGLEWSTTYVQHLRQSGFEAHQVDVAAVDPAAALPPCDVVLFMEAFEHMRYPGRIAAQLAAALKPGGRLLFSSQALGSYLPVRPYESVYVAAEALQSLCGSAGLETVECSQSAGRWLMAARRPACTA